MQALQLCVLLICFTALAHAISYDPETLKSTPSAPVVEESTHLPQSARGQGNFGCTDGFKNDRLSNCREYLCKQNDYKKMMDKMCGFTCKVPCLAHAISDPETQNSASNAPVVEESTHLPQPAREQGKSGCTDGFKNDRLSNCKEYLCKQNDYKKMMDKMCGFTCKVPCLAHAISDPETQNSATNAPVVEESTYLPARGQGNFGCTDGFKNDRLSNCKEYLCKQNDYKKMMDKMCGFTCKVPCPK